MNDHQRRIFGQMLDQLDDYTADTTSLEQLVSNLKGLLGAADIHDLGTINAFWDHLAPIDMQLELKTESWAPPGAFSQPVLAAAIQNYRAWIDHILNNPTEERL